MAKNEGVTQKDIQRIRSELSKELEAMSPAQRKKYLEAAADAYSGLSRMERIRQLAKA